MRNEPGQASAELRKLRTARGWTQAELADWVECDPTFISDIERGAAQLTLEFLTRIFEGLRNSPRPMQPAELFALNGGMSETSRARFRRSEFPNFGRAPHTLETTHNAQVALAEHEEGSGNRVLLGREDSNLRLADPESAALPLGHSPVRVGWASIIPSRA